MATQCVCLNSCSNTRTHTLNCYSIYFIVAAACFQTAGLACIMATAWPQTPAAPALKIAIVFGIVISVLIDGMAAFICKYGVAKIIIECSEWLINDPNGEYRRDLQLDTPSEIYPMDDRKSYTSPDLNDQL